MGGVEIDRKADPSTYQINGSLSTVFCLLNSMVGGTMLLIPLLFINTGIITSTIVIIVCGFTSWQTCDVYISHLKDDQFDVQESVFRILGSGWSQLFNIIAMIYLLITGVFYFFFINNFLFDIIAFFNENFRNQADLGSGQQFYYKMMILSAIVSIPLYGMLFLQKLTFLVQLAELGVYSIFAYAIFILYNFIGNFNNIINYNYSNDNSIVQIKWFSWDIGNLAGTAALAFTIHTTVGPMIKCSQYQNKNTKNLAITFFLGFVVYSFNGIIGYLGVLGKSKPDNPVSILSYFQFTDPQLLIVQIIYMSHLLTMFPILFSIFRMRFFQIFFKPDKPLPQYILFYVNTICIIICFLVRNIPDLPSSDISNFNGSVTCFFLVYLIPVFQHFGCLYGLFKTKSSQRYLSSKDQNHKSLEATLNKSHVQQEQVESSKDKSQSLIQTCQDHTTALEKSKLIRVTLYVFILIFGLTIFIYGLYTFGISVSQ